MVKVDGAVEKETVNMEVEAVEEEAEVEVTVAVVDLWHVAGVEVAHEEVVDLNRFEELDGVVGRGHDGEKEVMVLSYH